MAQYGYTAYTFRIHQHGRKDESLPLGEVMADTDGLVLLYGVLRGLSQTMLKAGGRYIRTTKVTGIGRTVRFTAEIGHDGVTASIIDPQEDDQAVFERVDRHIETNQLRGVLIAPKRSHTGLLILEVQGRTSARAVLCPALKRSIRHHTGLILDFAAVVDQEALQQFLNQAAIRGITLRRSGLPPDIADAVELARNDVTVGQLEMRIIPSGIKAFTRSVVEKIRRNDDTRRSLLQVGGLDFSDISFTMEVGQRQRTLTIDAAQIPSFIYNLPGSGPMADDAFFKEIIANVEEIATAVGVTVGTGWQNGRWSVKATRTMVTVPTEETRDEQDAIQASQ